MKPDQFLEHLSSHLKHTITGAIATATKLRHESVTPLHLLYALTQEHGSVGKEILLRVKIVSEDIYTLLRDLAPISMYESIPATTVIPELDLAAKKVLERAMLTAYEHGHQYVGTEHLLYGLIDGNGSLPSSIIAEKQKIQIELDAIFENMNKFPDMAEVKDALIQMQDMMVQDSEDHTHEPIRPTQKNTKHSKKRAPAQTALDVFTTNLSHKEFQSAIDPVIGRDREIERLIHILCRRTKNNPVLVGEPGVGKTAIVEGLAKKIALGDVPAVLKNKRIIALDLTLLIAGTIYRGEFESRLKQIIEEITTSPDTIVFIDEIHNIIGAGSNQGTMDAANILKPALARGLLHCIGATTLDEYKKHISADPALERRFQSILVEEPSRQETIDIIRGVKKYYEEFHHVSITEDAITSAVDLSIKYIHDNFLPDKAIDLVDEAAAAVPVARQPSEHEHKYHACVEELRRATTAKETAIHNESFSEAIACKKKETRLRKKLKNLEKAMAKESKIVSDTTVDSSHIIKVISRRLNISPEQIAPTEWDRIDRLSQSLSHHIIGQDEAINTIISGLKRTLIQTSKRKQPQASFLFVGPSGVGKTALAKAMAEELYHTEKALIRFDMSEFGEAHSLSKLLGSPAGYVGYRERNRFTDALREHPYAVVLFDEFDKAHPDVQKILLQILDEGELTDSAGKKISFAHSIIILTSNVSSEMYRHHGLGFESNKEPDKKQTQDRIREKIKEHFGHALTSRLTAIVPFTPLDRVALSGIMQQQINHIINNLSSSHGINITVSAQMIDSLLDRAQTKDHGARDIERIIDTVVSDAIASVLSNKPAKKTYRLAQKGEYYQLI